MKKVQRQPRFADVESALYEWFCRQRQAGIPVSGDMLLTTAGVIHSHLHTVGPSWTPDRGWLTRFQERHGIRSLKIAGESRSADVAAAVAYQHTFCRVFLKIGKIRRCLQFNADETGVFFRQLPDHTLAAKTQERQAKG